MKNFKLHLLRKSRKKPLVGDIFVIKIEAKKYIFGRVIRNDAFIGGFPNCNLLYIYRVFSMKKHIILYLIKKNY